MCHLLDKIRKNFIIQTLKWNIKGFFYYLLTRHPSEEPWMTPREKELLYATLAHTKVLLEFGSGGSTVYALKQGIKIFSIESSFWFMQTVKKLPIIKRALKDGNLRYYYANIGATRDLAYPVSDNASGKAYWNTSLCKIPLEKTRLSQEYWPQIDTIFIDGRCRVACTLNSLLHFPSIKYIIIHDYSNRDIYHIVENFLEKTNSADTLAVFKPKKDINREKIIATLSLYENVFH